MFDHHLLPELERFIRDLDNLKHGKYDTDRFYGYSFAVASHDFNKEIMEPNETHIDGILGIRCDDNFWICARLPYKFKDIPTIQIVNLLWPEIEDFSIKKDYYA